ncbi:MAG: cytochrome c [Gemmatimonadota bacterium]
MPSPVRLVGLLAITLTLGACTEIDNMLARVSFFAFMRESPAFDPYEAPRLPPDNSVAFDGPNGQVPAPMAPGEAGLQAFGEAYPNPIPRGAESEVRGEEMYARYCQICHGPAGMGGNTGSVTATGVYPPIAPPLAAGRATTLADGYIYGVIRAGRGLMPAYAVQIPHEDRWHIVNHIRRLQEGGGPSDGGAQAADGADSGGGQEEGE